MSMFIGSSDERNLIAQEYFSFDKENLITLKGKGPPAYRQSLVFMNIFL